MSSGEGWVQRRVVAGSSSSRTGLLGTSLAGIEDRPYALAGPAGDGVTAPRLAQLGHEQHAAAALGVVGHVLAQHRGQRASVPYLDDHTRHTAHRATERAVWGGCAAG